MEQIILTVDENYTELENYLARVEAKNILLVCGKSINMMNINHFFININSRKEYNVIKFDEFEPNPKYESVVRGVDIFNTFSCDTIIAVGGGSAIDVAKCIKLFSNMSDSNDYLEQTIIPNDITFIVMPTTAGTGSEATKYAVIYHDGEKQSITHESCIPDCVIFDETAVKTVPMYHRKAAMMDAFCHSIEAFWSINSTEESKKYAKMAINLILDNMEAYLNNDNVGNANMLKAANYAGKAINITQTTAGHAMAYKLTSIYNVAHGHAVTLCIRKLWPYMINHLDDCIDKRGKKYLEDTYRELASITGCDDTISSVERFEAVFDMLDFEIPQIASDEECQKIKDSVNATRLANNPVLLLEKNIDELYHMILDRSDEIAV